MTCPCGSKAVYEDCCGRFHRGEALPATAEALMRSRYSAFVKADVSWLRETTWPSNLKHFDEAGMLERATNSVWLGLTIHGKEDGGTDDTRGTVAFTARSMTGGELHEQHEKSLFKKKKRRWYYVKPVI